MNLKVLSGFVVWLSLLWSLPAFGQTTQELFDSGVQQHRQGNYQQAILLYDQLLQIDPGHSEAYRKRGLSYRELGDFDRCFQEYDLALAADPENVNVYRSYAIALQKLNRLEEALDWATRGLAIDPKFVNLWITRAVIYNEQKDYRAAIADYNRALELDPRDKATYNNRGANWMALGEYEAALADFERATEFDPRWAMALGNQAMALNKLKRYKKAKRAARAAIAINPDGYFAHFQLAESCRVTERLGEALAEYDTVLKLKPGHANSLLNRGWVFIELERYDDAIRDLNHYIELKPGSATAHNNLGVALRRSGDFQGALAEFDTALELKPDYKLADDNRNFVLGKMESTGTAPTAPVSAPVEEESVSGPEPGPAQTPESVVVSGAGMAPAASYVIDAKLLEADTWNSDDALWIPAPTASPAVPAALTNMAPPPPPLDMNNLELVDYNAAVIMAMESLRMVYGPMPPEDETRFGAKWAPFLDNPYQEIVDYLNKLNPLLSQFLSLRAGYSEEANNFRAALAEAAYAEGFGDAGGVVAAMDMARMSKDAMEAISARMRQITGAVLALGDPPNPLVERARARKAFFDIVQETNDLLPPVTSSKPKGAAGEMVLADTWNSVFIDTSSTHFKNRIDVTGNLITTTHESVPSNSSQKPYTQKFVHSWEGVPTRFSRNQKLELLLDVRDAGSGGTTYYRAALNVTVGTIHGPRAEVERAITELKGEYGGAWRTSGWYWRDLGSAGFSVDQTEDVNTPLSAEKKISESIGWGHSEQQESLQKLATRETVSASVLQFSDSSSAGSGRVFYLYIYDPTGDSVKEVDLESAPSQTVSAETPESILRRQFHQSNIIYFTERLTELRGQKIAAKDKSQREFLEWQIIAAESNLQGEKDAITRLDTGQWVRTRTRFDDMSYWQAARRSAKSQARWRDVRKKITGGYRMLRLAPIDQRADLREFLERQLDAETIARGDPDEVLKIVTTVNDRISGHWEHESASQQAIAWEQEENIFWAKNVKMGAMILLTGDVSKVAVKFGATLTEAQWIASGVGALYGGTTGYIEGGPGQALKDSLTGTGITGFAAAQAIEGYEKARAQGKDWKDAAWEGGKRGGTVLLLGKGLEYGVKGLSRWMGGKPPTVQEQFKQAQFRQQLEWDRALLDQFQRKQWDLAAAVSQGRPMQTVQALRNEIRGLTASINGSYGAKWFLKHHGSPIAQRAFIDGVEEIQEETMPVFMRNLESMGYDVSNLRFRSVRNASSAGSVGMDWDVMLADEGVTIMKNGQRVNLHTLQDDAQKAMNRSYFDQTGITARQTDIAVTTSVHPEAYWDPAWLNRDIDFTRLDPTRLNQAPWVTRYKASHVRGNPSMNGIQKTQEMCRGGAKDLDTKLLKYIEHKITTLSNQSGTRQQVQRLNELKNYWTDVRDVFARVGRQETDPEMIRRQMEQLRRMSGGKDAFDIVEIMGDFWAALSKVQ